MKNKFYRALLVAFCSLLLICCNKNESLSPQPLSDYTNLAVGKYVTYKLDSTVVLPFGVGFTVNSYQVKDSIDAVVTDNLGRPGYRIIRYIWDTAAKQWNNSNVFYAVQTGKTFEYTENNLRQTRLVSPIGGNLNWQGNSAASVSPFNFISNDDNYIDWTFTYNNVDMPFTVGNKTFDSTITVVQYDSMNNKSQDPNAINSYSKSYEVYAKGVGKIFQDLFSWEYQTSFQTRNCLLIHCENNKCDTTKIACNSDGSAGNDCSAIASSQASQGIRIVCDTIPGNFTYNGYGVRLSIINHN